MIIRAITLAVFLLFTVEAHTHPETLEQFEHLLSARDQGSSNLLGLLGFILAVSTAFGFTVYTQIKKRLTEETRSKILENESRNMVRLGLRDYENYIENKAHDAIAHSSLASAITHTRQAWFLASNMSEQLTYPPKNDLLALSGANLGYYYFEMMCTLKDIDTDLSEEYRKRAFAAVEAASLMIEACQRRKETVNCFWWEPLESLLRVQYACVDPKLPETLRKKQRKTILANISKLTDDLSVPAKAKSEIWQDWGTALEDEEKKV